MSMSVSLCMVVRDEQANLPDCLGSVAGLFADVVLVDTGSTDRTKDIAAQLGARVFDFPWCDDFAAARNETLRHAAGDWAFWLDADDRLDDANRDKLRTLLAGLGDDNAGYVLTSRSPSALPGEEATDVGHVRLFRNRPDLRWQYRAHEQILPALVRARADIRWTDIVIEHAGYRDPAQRRRKLERNLRLLHLDHADHPDEPFVLFNLGWSYLDLGRPDEALPFLRRSVERCVPGVSIGRKLYALLAQAHRRLGQLPDALAACRAGLARCLGGPNCCSWRARSCTSTATSKAPRPAGCGCCRLSWRQAGRPSPRSRGQRHAARARGAGADRLRQHGHGAARLQDPAPAGPALPGAGPPRRRRGPVARRPRRAARLRPRLGRTRRPGPGPPALARPGAGRRAAAPAPGRAAEATVLQARGQLARRQFAEARTLLEGALAADPQALPPRVLLTHALLQEGRDPAAAERALRDLLERAPAEAEAWRNLAVLLRQQGRPGEAAAACRSGLVHCPGDAGLRLRYGLLLHELGDLTTAETCLVRALEALPPAGPSPQAVAARHHLAQIYQAQRRPAEAELQWRAVVEKRPDVAAAWLGLADLLLAQRRWPELDAVAARLEALPEGQAEAAVVRARGCLARQDYEAAARIRARHSARHSHHFRSPTHPARESWRVCAFCACNSGAAGL